MAKWGEGDPRWIVEERPDATNVNNWHWSEKDAGKWSQERLKSLLLDVGFEADGKRVRINEVEKIEGEAIVNNRKAKLIYLYDWKITGKWEGVFFDSSFSTPLVSGTFEINGLGDENDIDEVDVEIITADTSDDGYAFKSLVRNVGVSQIRQSLQTYVDELKTDFAKDLIKPVTNKMSSTTTTTTTQKPTTSLNGVVSPAKPVLSNYFSNSHLLTAAASSSDSSSCLGVKISTTSISLQDSFKCDTERLFNIFTDPKLIVGWTMSPVDFELTRGASFRLFEGNVAGVVVDFVAGGSLKLRWRFKSWIEGHFSDVDIAFEKSENSTKIRLSQSGVPVEEEESTKDGWKRNIFRAIKAAFGVGELCLS